MTATAQPHDPRMPSMETLGRKLDDLLNPHWLRRADDGSEPATPVETVAPHPLDALNDKQLAGIARRIYGVLQSGDSDASTVAEVFASAGVTVTRPGEVDDDGLRTYTVVGLRDECGNLTVAGVFEGEHGALDSDPGGYDAHRYATSVQAADPDEAERLAREEAGTDDEADDDLDG